MKKEITDLFKNSEIAEAQNINSIKIEAELSLEKLNNIPKNSKEEMDIYVGNYNSNL